MADSFDSRYVTARRALLDVIDALGPQLGSVILIGAQAVYVHTGDAEFGVSPFTFDTDLAINPRTLAPVPGLLDIMLQAGFTLSGQPGIYTRTADNAQVDLLVPEALGGSGRRGARLGTQGNRSAMKVRGIEGSLVDNSDIQIVSLDRTDTRTAVIKVAGPAALLVSKVIKVAERSRGVSRRADDKDAFDIFRLLRSIETGTLANRLDQLLRNRLVTDVASEALAEFEKLFTGENSYGVQMVVSHIRGIEPEETIAASCIALSQDLVDSIRHR